jgi:hypothetical protein
MAEVTATAGQPYHPNQVRKGCNEPAKIGVFGSPSGAVTVIDDHNFRESAFALHECGHIAVHMVKIGKPHEELPADYFNAAS